MSHPDSSVALTSPSTTETLCPRPLFRNISRKTQFLFEVFFLKKKMIPFLEDIFRKFTKIMPLL